MYFPFFTETDAALSRAGSERDPLGLQAVWSTVGRALVPYLAGPVTQINGIKAVLLIYWLSDTILKRFDLQEDVAFRGYFRLMEGLIEHYLWSIGKERKYAQFCFGTRVLNTSRFEVVTSDRRTAVNGLYQYYRGTCRRAGLLGEDWTIDDGELRTAFQAAWPTAASTALARKLKDALTKKKPFSPADALAGSPEIATALASVFNAPPLQEALAGRILGQLKHRALAGKYIELSDSPVPDTEAARANPLKWRMDNLYAWLQQNGCPAASLRSAMEDVLRCEPFLVTVQNCFDLLRASAGATLANLHKELTPYSALLIGRATSFRAIGGGQASARMTQMQDLAACLVAEANMEKFLHGLIAHHRLLMEERNRAPLVALEGETLCALVAPERTRHATLNRLQSGAPWDNSYYLYSAGVIYGQLFNRRNEQI